jgi:hypothetical protein
LAGAVVWGNTLTMEIHETWRLPVYYLNGWDARIALRNARDLLAMPSDKPIEKPIDKPIEKPAEPIVVKQSTTEYAADATGQMLFNF